MGGEVGGWRVGWGFVMRRAIPIHRAFAMNGYPASLEGEQAIKEGAVAPEALTEILGGYIVALGPLLFELGAFIGELLGDALYYVGDEAVGLLDGLTRLVDEGGLDLVPTCAEVMQLIVGEQRA